MAKKKKSPSSAPAGAVLPQNIVSIGDQQPEDKHIYISQTAYKAIHAFTKNKTKNEAGGMLVGKVIQAFGKSNILINGFVEAKDTQSTPTTLTFTHETWNACHKTIDKSYPGQKIVGWIHTHPNYGIFLSNHDKFIQESTFSDENQVAMVVDPIQGEEGFFFWKNGAIERCPGFYVFDKNGQKITVDGNVPAKAAAQGGDMGWVWKLLTGVLAVAVLVLTFSLFSLRDRVNSMEQQLDRYEPLYEALLPFVSFVEEPPAEDTGVAAVPGETDMETVPEETVSETVSMTEEGGQTP